MSKIFKAVGGLISKLMPKVELPEMPSMPDPGSTSAKIAARKKIQDRAKSGRDGTIYSGGGNYNQTNLGGTV